MSSGERHKLGLLDVGTLFHAVLFSLQKGLAEVMKAETTPVVTQYMMPYLEEVAHRTPFGEILEYGDAEETLKRFGELLVESELAESVEVERTDGGFLFKVNGCVFAEHIHEMLRPTDVTCPFGIIAFYLSERCSGKRVKKALSEFTPTDSYTSIEFIEGE
jgi:hypothetical protein